MQEVDFEDLSICGILQVGDIIRHKVQNPLETYVGKFKIVDVVIEQSSTDIGLIVHYTTREIDYATSFYHEPSIKNFAARLTTFKHTTEEDISEETRNEFIKLLE